jgi:hypothetical protein
MAVKAKGKLSLISLVFLSAELNARERVRILAAGAGVSNGNDPGVALSEHPGADETRQGEIGDVP